MLDDKGHHLPDPNPQHMHIEQIYLFLVSGIFQIAKSFSSMMTTGLNKIPVEP